MTRTSRSLTLKVAMLTALCVGEAATAAAASNWTMQFPGGIANGTLFPIQLSHSAVYDPGTSTLIVFGGIDVVHNSSNNAVTLLSNANGLVGNPTWSTLIANGLPGSPPIRASSSAVYDQANNRLIVFGGATYPDINSPPTGYLNDVWVLTNANGQGGTPAWTQLSPPPTLPAARIGQSAAYDSLNNRLVIYGGSDASNTYFDVWVLSNANGLGGAPAWQKLSPSGGPPVGGHASSAVYDATNNIMTVFGGYYKTPAAPLGFVLYNYVWTLSHANGLGGTPHWTNIAANGAVGSPGKRAGHSAIYDAANNRMTIYGGGSFHSSEFPEFSDVWVLANANGLGGTPAWTQLHPTGIQPSRREDHSAVYDAVNNRMVVYGGDSAEALFYGVWVLTGANGL